MPRYFKIEIYIDNSIQVTDIATERPAELKAWDGKGRGPYAVARGNGAWGKGWCDRTDFDSMERATLIAKGASWLTGNLWIAVDSGANVSPRFDVMEAPTIGDKVSRGFNGDYYPCGKIARISPSMRLITTDDGTKFYRQGSSARWVNRSFALVPGHRNERNPHF